MPPCACPCTWVHDTNRGCRWDVLLDTAARSINMELDDRGGTRRAFVTSFRITRIYSLQFTQGSEVTMNLNVAVWLTWRIVSVH